MINCVLFVHTGHDITALLLAQELKPLGCPGGSLSGKHPVFDLDFNPPVCCILTRIEVELFDILICIKIARN